MYELFVKAVITAALIQFGISTWEFENCHSQKCLRKIEDKTRVVLKINWKPVSIFEHEANKFR
jgi:hypothetical protein